MCSLAGSFFAPCDKSIPFDYSYPLDYSDPYDLIRVFEVPHSENTVLKVRRGYIGRFKLT
jgi:hypothetical protein